jgi:DNA polymerase-3 subunit gamma/tau
VLVVKIAPKGHGSLDRSPAELERLQKFAAQASIEELHTLFELLSTTEMRVRDSSQPIWMLEVSLIKLASLPPLLPLDALITRLESLERRLGLTTDGDAYEMPSLASAVRENITAVEHPSSTVVPKELSPSPPSALSGAVAQPASASEIVHKIIEGASSRPLGWILEQHCKMEVTDSSLEIIFHGNNRMAHELLHEDGTLGTLQQIVRGALGRDMEVRIIDAPTVKDDQGRAATNPTSPDANLFALTRAPIVRETLELFGGRILDVRYRTVSREAKDRPMSEDEMVSQEDVDDE